MRASWLALVSSSLVTGCGAGREVRPEDEGPGVHADAPPAERGETEAAPSATARRIASGDGYDCVIEAGGQLFCWLEGGAPRAIERFAQTTSLSGHAPPGCAVRSDGTLACFAIVDTIGGPAIVFVDHARYAWTDVGAVARVASPCVILVDGGALECLLPRYPGPLLFRDAWGLEEDRERPRVRVGVGVSRDVASTRAQVCVVHDEGALSCFRPGHAPRRVPGLPPMARVALGAGPAEIVCGLSIDDELVCFASRGAPSTVRIPGVRDVAVHEGVVCAAALDGRVACFGSAEDRTAFETGPRVIAALEHVTQLSVGPRHACALTEDERVRCFDPRGSGSIEDVALPRRSPD